MGRPYVSASMVTTSSGSLTAGMPRLLVVGGGGFIGRRIVQAGIARGWEVTSLGLSAVPAETGRGSVRRISADISQKGALGSALGGQAFEYVVNCGGYIDHAPYFASGRQVFEAHFGGLRHLVELMDRRVLAGLVNLGSSDEYGNAAAPQREEQREAPISPYSLGKVASTHFLQMLHRTEGLPAATLRLFLCYGPGQDSARFLPQVIRACLRNESFPASEGNQRRDFCFVDDVVAAVFAALTTPGARGEVINIGSGHPISIREAVETVQSRIGGGDPQFGRIAYRPGENMDLFSDIAKARRILGWNPSVDFETGVEETIRWMKENQ